MATPKVDLKLEAFLTQGIDTTKSLQNNHPVGVTVAASVNTLLTDTRTEYRLVLDKVKAERSEAQAAARRLDSVELRSAKVFTLLYNAFQAERWKRKSGPQDEAQQFEDELDDVLGGTTPSKFAELGLDRTIVLLGDTVELGEEVLGADHAEVAEAKAVRTELEAARSLDDAEASDLQMAMTELMAIRSKVRRNYSAARKMLAGVLELEEYDDLHSLLPPLDAIYRPSSDTTEDDEEPVPAPEPA